MAKLFSDMQLSSLCLKLSLAWKSGVGLEASLSGWQSDKEVFQVMRQLADGETGGEKLYETMERTGRFPAYVTGLLETADAAGKTEETLMALSDYYLKKDVRARQVKAALLYPSVLLVLMLAVVVLILVKVMPVFASVYAQLGSELTGAAGVLLSIGHWLGTAAPALCGVLAIIMAAGLMFCFWGRARTWLIRTVQDRFGDKGVMRKLADAKIVQCLQMGLAAGMTYTEAVLLAARLVADNAHAAKRCSMCAELLTVPSGRDEHGLPFSLVMPLEYVEIMNFGSAAGSLDAAMAEISQRMQEDAERALDDIVSRIEPAIVIAASLMIGVILLSVMLPLMNIMSAIC